MSDPMATSQGDASHLHNNNNCSFRNAPSPAPSVVSTTVNNHYHTHYLPIYPPPPSQFDTGLTTAVQNIPGGMTLAPVAGPLTGVSLVCVESIWKKEDLFLMTETLRVRGDS
jgi:hypothetical protein